MSPLHFATTKLGIIPWSKMAEIFSAVEPGRCKILVRSCNGADKTTVIGALCNSKLSNELLLPQISEEPNTVQAN